MLPYEALIKNGLVKSQTSEWLKERLAPWPPEQLGSLFVQSLFLRSVLKPLIDEEWLRQQQGHSEARERRTVQLHNELRSLAFVSEELVNADSPALKKCVSQMNSFIGRLISVIRTEPQNRFRETLIAAMKLIDVRARELDRFPTNVFSQAMYRAFDEMDEVLGIRYELDLKMPSDPGQRERLYEGAGIGVQTSYSSILLALDRACVKPGARVLDLGSGYGRVGFVLGLLRPDLFFTGYEYVDHRVQDSRAVCQRLGLHQIEFETRDLSVFELPRGDVYYLYDPFSRDTYATILNQLIEIGSQQSVTIITKGRANTWVRDALNDRGWLIDDTCDSGTVCLFKSPTSAPI